MTLTGLVMEQMVLDMLVKWIKTLHINLRPNFHVEFVTEKTLSGQFEREIL